MKVKRPVTLADKTEACHHSQIALLDFTRCVQAARQPASCLACMIGDTTLCYKMVKVTSAPSSLLSAAAVAPALLFFTPTSMP